MARVLVVVLSCLSVATGCGAPGASSPSTDGPSLESTPPTTAQAPLIPDATAPNASVTTTPGPTHTAPAVPAGHGTAHLAGPFSFANWGTPDDMLIDLPDNLTELRAEADTAVVARLVDGAVVPVPLGGGLFVLPFDPDGKPVPTGELRAARLMFAVDEVLGGLHAPVTGRDDNLIEVFVPYTAGPDYEPLYQRVLEQSVSHGARYVLFLDNMRDSGFRTTSYVVDPTISQVLGIADDGTVGLITPAFVPWEPEGSVDANPEVTTELLAVLARGFLVEALAITDSEEVVEGADVEEIIGLIKAPTGPPAHPTGSFRAEELALQYPPNARSIEVADASIST